MTTAQVGALRIDLTMDAGEFRKGAKDAEGVLGTLERKFGVASGTIARFGAAFAGAFSVAAIGRAIKSAIDTADAMGKAAQAANLSVEEFSALAHAAELSGLSVEEFSAALSRFNRNIAEAGQFGSQASAAFGAIGVATKDAAGLTRDMGDILGDVADRFSIFGNSAEKAALAQELFGRAGARLLPLLNQGKDGIAALKDEAARLGVVVSAQTARDAEELNDNLTRLGAAVKGLALDIAGLVAGPLAKLLEAQLEMQKREREAITGAAAAIRSKADEKKAIQELTAETQSLIDKQQQLRESGRLSTRQFQMIQQQIVGNIEALRNLGVEFAKQQSNKWSATIVPPDPQEIAAWEDAEQRIANALRAEPFEIATQRAQEYGDVLANLKTPMTEFQAKMLELQRASQDAAADQSKLAAATVQAWANMQAGIAGVASNLSGALAELFNKNKGFALANALVSTYEAVAKALANPPGPPFSYVNAAAALIKGIAQVRAIQNTHPGGGGGATAGGGGDVASNPAPAAAAVPQTRVLQVNGLNPSHLFTGDVVRSIAETLKEYQRDGGQVIIA